MLLIEDDNIIIQGFYSILAKNSRLKLVEVAPKLVQAVTWCRRNSADIILISGNHCHFESIKKLQTLIRLRPDAGIILYSTRDNYSFLLKALEIGVRGIVSINAKVEDIIDAIKVVNARQKFLSPDIAQVLALHRSTYAKHRDLYELLSSREMEIMLMVTQGVPVQVIAQRLQLSPKTVNSYRYRMFSKLNIRSDVELTHMAISYGLITMEQVYQSD
nr:LuxR C-terminal-related transcriptional regulator [uncultured Moellerella sp.]